MQYVNYFLPFVSQSPILALLTSLSSLSSLAWTEMYLTISHVVQLF